MLFSKLWLKVWERGFISNVLSFLHFSTQLSRESCKFRVLEMDFIFILKRFIFQKFISRFKLVHNFIQSHISVYFFHNLLGCHSRLSTWCLCLCKRSHGTCLPSSVYHFVSVVIIRWYLNRSIRQIHLRYIFAQDIFSSRACSCSSTQGTSLCHLPRRERFGAAGR